VGEYGRRTVPADCSSLYEPAELCEAVDEAAELCEAVGEAAEVREAVDAPPAMQ